MVMLNLAKKKKKKNRKELWKKVHGFWILVLLVETSFYGVFNFRLYNSPKNFNSDWVHLLKVSAEAKYIIFSVPFF